MTAKPTRAWPQANVPTGWLPRHARSRTRLCVEGNAPASPKGPWGMWTSDKRFKFKSGKGTMKLLLTSAGIRNASIHNALVELLGKPVAEKWARQLPVPVYAIDDQSAV